MPVYMYIPTVTKLSHHRQVLAHGFFENIPSKTSSRAASVFRALLSLSAQQLCRVSDRHPAASRGRSCELMLQFTSRKESYILSVSSVEEMNASYEFSTKLTFPWSCCPQIVFIAHIPLLQRHKIGFLFTNSLSYWEQLLRRGKFTIPVGSVVKGADKYFIGYSHELNEDINFWT
jgi:hypothetical protein